MQINSAIEGKHGQINELKTKLRNLLINNAKYLIVSFKSFYPLQMSLTKAIQEHVYAHGDQPLEGTDGEPRGGVWGWKGNPTQPVSIAHPEQSDENTVQM